MAAGGDGSEAVVVEGGSVLADTRRCSSAQNRGWKEKMKEKEKENRSPELKQKQIDELVSPSRLPNGAEPDGAWRRHVLI